jgi:hypothetical protein
VTAHSKCPTCGADVEVEIRIDACRDADGPHVDMIGTEVTDMECSHRGDVLLWLDSDDGYKWAIGEVEKWRLTA